MTTQQNEQIFFLLFLSFNFFFVLIVTSQGCTTIRQTYQHMLLKTMHSRCETLSWDLLHHNETKCQLISFLFFFFSTSCFDLPTPLRLHIHKQNIHSLIHSFKPQTLLETRPNGWIFQRKKVESCGFVPPKEHLVFQLKSFIFSITHSICTEQLELHNILRVSQAATSIKIQKQNINQSKRASNVCSSSIERQWPANVQHQTRPTTTSK